jgi:hypothetical protein
MTVLGRLKIAFRAVVVAVVVLMGLNFGVLLWVNGWQDQTDRAVKDLQAAGDFAIAVDRMAASVGDLSSLLVENSGVGFLANAFKSNGGGAAAALDSILGAKAPGSEEAAPVESLKAQLGEYREAGDRLLASGGVDVTNVLTRRAPVATMGTELRDSAAEYQDDLGALVAARLARLGLVGMVCLIVTAVLGLTAVIAGAILSWLLPHRIGRTLTEAATDISSSAAELMAVASQVSAGAAQTAASTNETTVTVEEVKQTAMLAHEKASAAAEGAQNAVGLIGSARALTDETASGIERMQAGMDVVSETINRLSDRTQAAGEVIAMVNDLAEQSNLLSVNASIEAAKAGDYGKGFTVVAQEVKSLAEQSKQAVAQVRAMLGEIQKASQTAVQAAAHGRGAVEDAKLRSMEAGEVMERVSDGAVEDSQSSLQVVASARQQLAGMEQIAQAIASINEAGNQSVGGTRQVEQEVKHLQDLALKLKQMVQAEATE